jgi:hypothetical protein
MTWAKKLKEHGKSKRKTPPVVPKPVVQECWLQIRGASGSDPGAVDPVFYVIESGLLTVTDSTGKALEKAGTHRLMENEDPRQVAKRLAARRRLTAAAEPDFNRVLHYPRNFNIV